MTAAVPALAPLSALDEIAVEAAALRPGARCTSECLYGATSNVQLSRFPKNDRRAHLVRAAAWLVLAIECWDAGDRRC